MLRYCEVSDVSAISSLTGLTYVSLEGNRISDLSPLANLTDLEYLGLEFNQIDDISPLLENDGLGQGDTVRLAGNPLNNESVGQYIPALSQRGVAVYYTQPTPTPLHE